ncbi:transposase [Capilliphycus salinus ALCB114379]|uniref:transposase n=1 Tax=Capilliphycus salinus TaxID=2768948 RepID=UPI0039A486BC
MKGSKYILLKRKENLKEEQKEKLDTLIKASALLAAMHELKEEFTTRFDCSKNLGEGTLKLLEWMVKAKPFFPKFVCTLKKWFVEIVGPV